MKTSKIEIRLTDQEKELVKQAAVLVSLSISDFVRERILDTSRSIVLVNEERMTEQKMVKLENVRATYLSMKSATADMSHLEGGVDMLKERGFTDKEIVEGLQILENEIDE